MALVTILQCRAAQRARMAFSLLVIQMEQILIDDCAVLVHGYYNSTFLSNASKVTGADIHTVDYYWLSTEIAPK